VGSQASWTRAKFYNFPLKVSPPPFPAPPPIYTLAPAKQLTHISVSAYATKWPKVAAIDGLVISYDFVSFFFCFQRLRLISLLVFIAATAAFVVLDCSQHLRGENKRTSRRAFLFWQTEGTRATDATDDSGWTEINFLFSRSSSTISAASCEKASLRKTVRNCLLRCKGAKFLNAFIFVKIV